MKSIYIKPIISKQRHGWIHTICILTILITLHATPIQAQTLVNQLWQVELNYPDTVTWSASVLSGSNLITTGNTFNSIAQKTNIVTTKTDQNGSVVWQAEYNGTESEFDYGAAVTVDGSGNVFVTGASHSSDAYTFDVVVIKYNSTGVQQWATTFDGTGSNNDIPSDILLVGTEIYICAASIGTSTNYDYLLLKLNASGAVQWNKRYDYTSLFDIPGHLATNGTDLVVSGASQSSATNWDYTSLKYNASGTLLNTKRTAAAGYGFDRPTGLVVDASDNFYIAGYTYNGSNYDMRTIKLDDDLSTVWVKTENGGAEDGSNAICIDASANTYIAGFTESSAGNKLMKIIKYNSAGTTQWTKILQNASNDINAEVSGITYNATSDKVIITGFYEYSTGKKVITTYALNATNGNLGWKKDYPNLNASIDVPTGVHSGGNNIWVYGRRTVSDTTRYVTIKYETYEKPTSYGTDPSGDTTYLDNEIIVRIVPKYVNHNFVNNKQQVFSNLQDAISDTLYNILEPILNPQNIQFTPLAVKIFKEFAVADTFSISRLGDTVKLKKHWSTIIITTPDANSVFSIIDTLNTLDNFIIYAHPNCLGKLQDVPNDFYIVDDFQQESLIESVAFPNADINMVPAWDIETGKEYVRVGVFDGIVFWSHEDFGDGTFLGSKIVAGYDFNADLSAELIDNPPSSHATSCAGIIGALRNNDVGIAGIAGGDIAGTGGTGVSLYTLGILNEGFWITLADVSNAIAQSAIFNPATDLGYGLHIQNHSWGIEVGDITGEGAFTEDDMLVLRDVVETAFENNCILVASRGNDGDDDLSYPACYADGWVINVGASGTNGAHKHEDNGDSWWESSFGGNVDFIAPGTTQIVAAPINPDFPYPWDVCEVDLTGYSCFNGTSSAAPHVSGLAALLLSRHNIEQGYPNNLAVEDVENILQNTAHDVSGEIDGFIYAVDYDQFNGFGLIEAAIAMQNVNLPNYMVYHNNEPVSESVTTAVHQYVFVNDPESELAATNYFADRYQISRTYLNVFPTTTNILDSWIRWSSTIGTSAANPVSGEQYADFTFSIIDNVASVSVTTFAWHVTENAGTGADVDVWIPADLDHIRTDYSLHLFDPEGIVNIETDLIALNQFNVYPNPGNGEFTISGITESNTHALIFNQMGELIFSETRLELGDYTIDISNQPSGIYFIKLISDSGSETLKVIKQ